MILRNFIYHSLVAIAIYLLLRTWISFEDSKPVVFLGLFGSVFMVIWLITFFLNRTYFIKLPRLFKFIGFIMKELIISNLRVAYDILAPVTHMSPAIIAVPLDVATDHEIVVFATILTLTPGTLSLKVSEDRKTLYLHEMYIPNKDAESFKRHVKKNIERRILELTR